MTAPDPRLNEIQARLDAATPGPWFREYGDVITNQPDPRDTEEGYEDPRSVRVVRAAPHLPKKDKQAISDAEFIAAAPADVRYLLAELRKAHEALDELMYAANHKAADNQIGRSWAEVIRGPIIRHLGAEAAGKMGAAVAAAKGDE